jgi:hypothetical protein
MIEDTDPQFLYQALNKEFDEPVFHLIVPEVPSKKRKSSYNDASA